MIFMVLVDGSEQASKAFEKAIGTVKEGDTLLICHACQYPEIAASIPIVGMPVIDPQMLDLHKQAIQDNAKQLVTFYLEQAQERGVRDCHSFVLAEGRPKEQSITFAIEKKVDTIFVGTRGLGAIQRFFLGSFSNYIVHHAPCDVLLVK
eukprot:c13525_g1_i2.p1 GENE.c13525_g1_i2~~c13525_g1_i2.p1  ORF type:complete len:149 (+),score=24.80 c13525_g1_i2:171-617(+)